MLLCIIRKIVARVRISKRIFFFLSRISYLACLLLLVLQSTAVPSKSWQLGCLARNFCDPPPLEGDFPTVWIIVTYTLFVIIIIIIIKAIQIQEISWQFEISTPRLMSARFCRGKFSPSPVFICMLCLLESCALFAVWFTNDDSKIFSAAVHAGNRFTAIDVVMAHVCDLVRTRHSGLLRPRFAPLHAISTSGIITAMICFATFCAFACVCARVFVHACLHPHYSLFFLCSRLTSHSALRSPLFSCLWSAVSRSRSSSRSLFLVVVFLFLASSFSSLST